MVIRFWCRWESGRKVAVEGVVTEWSAKWSGHRVVALRIAVLEWSYDPRAVAMELVVGWL